jgi:hypothetical protein
MRRYLLGGVVVEPRVHLVLFLCFRSFGFLCFLFFIFDLLYKRFSSPPYIGSAVGCYIIYSGAKAYFAISFGIASSWPAFCTQLF